VACGDKMERGSIGADFDYKPGLQHTAPLYSRWQTRNDQWTQERVDASEVESSVSERGERWTLLCIPARAWEPEKMACRVQACMGGFPANVELMLTIQALKMVALYV